MELKPCHRRPLRPDEIGPRVMELSKYLRKNFNAAVAEQGQGAMPLVGVQG